MRRLEAVDAVVAGRHEVGATHTGFDLDTHLFFMLTQVMDRRDRQLTAYLRDYGLSVPKWRVLATLKARRKLSMLDLAGLTSLDPSTLSRTIDQMVEAGCVVRLADASDLRVVRVALTRAGVRRFAQVWPRVSDLNRAALVGIDAPDRQALIGMLSSVRSNLGAHLTGR